MDHSDAKQWDPYQTSHRRDFVYRPNSSEPVYGTSTSKVHINPYTLDKPVDTKTVYNEEFSWKPTSKPAFITGTVSGNRRNNPHPSESFMVWRLPRGLRSAYNGKPGTSLPSEQQITDALSGQYRSTYRTDYLGIPQGVQKPTKLKPLSLEKMVSYTIDTEMRHNYCKPSNKPDLQGNTTRYGCNALHGVAPKGIVPTVVHSHIRNQETRKQLTSYDMHFGGKTTDISEVLRSLQPQELKQLYQHLPQKDKDAVDAFLLMTSRRSQVKKGSRSPHSPCKPDWLSAWAGPL
ncbi:testis-expressed protein 26-like [Alosa sapidissima]|uniref:testis-expressed protein 26-like n=1 Tax=Alosa sapidissima TaxID=34773 RepID=UPI001C090790|nr:testis-expressed protein 26-like [Alosa sapidissima]